eukprot:2467381-Rhodomonas_salina.2
MAESNMITVREQDGGSNYCVTLPPAPEAMAGVDDAGSADESETQQERPLESEGMQADVSAGSDQQEREENSLSNLSDTNSSVEERC